MIEVLASFECVPNTFFIAVDIMDEYLSKTKEVFESKSIHLIGITSMILASKVEEITPFKVSTAVEKMSHGKLTAKEIVKCELEILTAFDFRIMSTSSLFVSVEMTLVRLNIHNSLIWKDFMKVIVYITKMTMHEYKILQKYPLQYLCCGCVYLGFKIIEQTKTNFNVKIYLEEMKNIYNLDEMIFYKVSEDILELAKNFEKNFGFVKNLLKYDSFYLEKLE